MMGLLTHGGEWYVHFASCFYINIYCIMGYYYTLCHNTYAYSLLFYKVYIKRENAGSWDSGLEKEQILETYSAQLQKSWNFTEVNFRIYNKYWVQEVHQGGHTLRPLPRGPPRCPPTPTPTLYICFQREKNQREEIIAFYDTEPPPSPKISRGGWSRVRSGLRRGGFVAVVIINHPPSPISWCSPPCVSNSIVGLLKGDGLDEIYHVIELVLLGFNP